MIRTTSSSIMPTVVNNGGKEIPTGLLVTLSITFVSPAPFLCPYISVSLFHALSRYLCVSLGVSVSLMPPFVYSTSNSLLKATHTHARMHIPPKIWRHKLPHQCSFSVCTLKHGPEMGVFQSQLNQGKWLLYLSDLRS